MLFPTKQTTVLDSAASSTVDNGLHLPLNLFMQEYKGLLVQFDELFQILDVCKYDFYDLFEVVSLLTTILSFELQLLLVGIGYF